MNDKILSLLGLAARGKNLESGEFSTEKAVKEGRAALVIVSCDASANTKKLFEDKCSFYKTPVCFCGTKETLGRAIGKGQRSSIAVTDKGMAENIIKRLEES